MSEKLTKAEYARRKNWNRSTVTRFVQAGRLVETADGLIDVEASEARLAATEARDDMKAHHAAGRGETDTPTQPSSTGDPAVDRIGNSLQAAKAVKEKYAAMTAKLEYEKAIGKYIEKESVEAIVADVIITLRQSLEGLIHRAGTRLVMQPHDTVRAIIKEEVFEMLSSMERDFSEQLKELTEEAQA